MRAPLTAADEAIAEIAPEVLEVLNGMYGDSIAFVARVLGGGDRVVVAEAVGVDARGLRLRIVDRYGARHVWIDFPEPVDDPDSSAPTCSTSSTTPGSARANPARRVPSASATGQRAARTFVDVGVGRATGAPAPRAGHPRRR